MRQANEIDRLERAAEEADEPAQIEQTAAQPKADRRPKASKVWFVPYLVVGAILGAAIFLLDWKESLLRPSTAEKVHRYLVGALAIAIVFGSARAVEIYAIERVH